MARPTRKYPSFGRLESRAAAEGRNWLANYIGDTQATPAARIGGRIHLFRLSGTRGLGLLAETEEPVGERPGVFRDRISIWARPVGAADSQALELELHAFDLWAEALATGDDHWLKVKRAEMYAERDRRTAVIAAELDRGRLFDLPAGAVPAMLVGLNPDEVRALAEQHAPELLLDRDAPTVWAMPAGDG